ncbi:MAG TPA: hypothetical protein VFS92_01550 [Planctomycetota bacterium]|nr:hypothetical protein [Planctomycetota bacterium]
MNTRRAVVLALAAACLPACRSGAFVPLPVTAAPLPAGTVVTPHLDAFLPEGKSVLWCATMPMAWDAARWEIFAGEPLLLGPPADPELAAAMSTAFLPAVATDPASCVVVAGEAPEATARFAREVKERFGRMVAIPEFDPNEFAALSWLSKDLRFLHEFEACKSPIRFAGSGREVRAFGINGRSRVEKLGDVLGQVTVHRKPGDAASPDAPDQVVLEFALQEKDDRLLLAMVPRGATLRAAWEAVRDAAAGTGGALPRNAVLSVPRIDFDLTRRFTELEGPVTSPAIPRGALLRLVEQRVALRLDQTGARLLSEGRIFGLKGESPFVFDRPFLLALARRGAEIPYLLLGVGNDDLLVRE